jgi:hypothetical protein
MSKTKTDENEEIIKSISNFFDRASVRFLWFVAGAFFGYLWMAKAYRLF